MDEKIFSATEELIRRNKEFDIHAKVDINYIGVRIIQDDFNFSNENFQNYSIVSQSLLSVAIEASNIY